MIWLTWVFVESCSCVLANDFVALRCVSVAPVKGFWQAGLFTGSHVGGTVRDFGSRRTISLVTRVMDLARSVKVEEEFRREKVRYGRTKCAHSMIFGG